MYQNERVAGRSSELKRDIPISPLFPGLPVDSFCLSKPQPKTVVCHRRTVTLEQLGDNVRFAWGSRPDFVTTGYSPEGPNEVPEPASMLVFAGVLGAGLVARRRHSRELPLRRFAICSSRIGSGEFGTTWLIPSRISRAPA